MSPLQKSVSWKSYVYNIKKVLLLVSGKCNIHIYEKRLIYLTVATVPLSYKVNDGITGH